VCESGKEPINDMTFQGTENSSATGGAPDDWHRRRSIRRWRRGVSFLVFFLLFVALLVPNLGPCAPSWPRWVDALLLVSFLISIVSGTMWLAALLARNGAPLEVVGRVGAGAARVWRVIRSRDERGSDQ
jgi:hypothetical protein